MKKYIITYTDNNGEVNIEVTSENMSIIEKYGVIRYMETALDLEAVNVMTDKNKKQ